MTSLSPTLRLVRFHERVKKRNHRARALKNLLTSVGVTVPKEAFGQQDMTCKTYCVDVIQHLVDEFGADNVRLALRLLVETNEANSRHIRASVVTALVIVIARHEYGQLGLALFDAMDRVDVGELVQFARKLRHRARDHESDILLGLIAAELRRHLGDLG